MRKMIRYMIGAVLMVVALASATDAHAQRYPERRTARQGNRLYDKADYAAAEVNYRKALALNNLLYEADFNLGDAVYKQERYDEAAKIFGRVAADTLRTASEKAEALFNMGNAQFSERKFAEAIESYKSSLRLVPDDKECKFNLAYAQKMLQEEQNRQQQQQNDQNQDQQQNQDNKDNQDNQDNKDNQNNDDRDQQNKDQEPEGDKPEDNKENPGEQPQNQPQNQQGQQPRMTPQQADQLLQAVQGEEDKTRDKMDKQKVVGVGRSGKNW